MDKSFLTEVKNNLTMEELKKFKKELRENITKCLDDERKTNEKFDKRFYEAEMDMFSGILKDIDSYFEYRSQIVSKLRNSFWLYSFLMDIDKRLEDVNFRINDLKEMTL